MRSSVTAPQLIVLVADRSMEQAAKALLSRSGVIGTTDFCFKIIVHPRHDPGCLREAVEYLRPFLSKDRYCVVMFDHKDCGSKEPRQEIQAQLEEDLRRNGWDDRAKVVAIQPELEAWVWGDLTTASSKLGWLKKPKELRQLLEDVGLWPEDKYKPPDPKEAVDATLAYVRRERRREKGLKKRDLLRTPRLYRAIATSARVDNCRDPAFQELRGTLQRWFPPEAAS